MLLAILNTIMINLKMLKNKVFKITIQKKSIRIKK